MWANKPRGAALLLPILAAVALPRHAASTYAGPGAANAAAISASVATLAALGRPLHVGLLNVLPPGAPTQLGIDGFARLSSATSAAASAILAAPLNSSVPVNASDVEGALPWLLNWLAAEASVNVSYSVFRLPEALQNSADFTAQVLAAMSAGGYDTVAFQLGMNAARLQYTRLVPLQGFGYTVVTTRPAPTPVGTWDRAFIWAYPFTWRLWLVFASSVVLSSFIMLFFEKGRNREQFDNEAIGSHMEAVGHSLFLAAMGASLKEMFAPATAAGRVYTATSAFTIFLIMSIYVANLAAVFTTSPPLEAAITDINSFVAQGLPLCARNTSGQLAWLQANYPAIAQNGLLVTPGVDTASVLAGILSGACAGAISTTADVSFALGATGDPDGVFCNLLPVGPILDSLIYALPFTSNLTQISPAAFDAVSKMVAYAINNGNYTADALAVWMPDDTNRPQCASLVASNAADVAFALSGALDIHDLAGVFLIQAAGFVAAILLLVSKPMRKAMYGALNARVPPRWRLGPPAHLSAASHHHADHLGHELGATTEEEDVAEIAEELGTRLAMVAARRRARAKQQAGGEDSREDSVEGKIPTTLLPAV